MTGAEHYAEAERLIEASYSGTDQKSTEWQIQAAQVHATLALAAFVEWREAIR